MAQDAARKTGGDLISTVTMARKTAKQPDSSPSTGPDKIIAIRCTAEYRKRVDQAAKKEFRDSSGLIALALQEYFEKRGYDPLPSRLGDNQ